VASGDKGATEVQSLLPDNMQGTAECLFGYRTKHGSLAQFGTEVVNHS
jgi:hypothetical protein